MARITVSVVRRSPERTNDNTVKRFLEFLAQRALPSNSSWRATAIQRQEPRRLPEFGWEFAGVIEFTKRGGRLAPDLISREKSVILKRLRKAGKFARWGEGRKWSVTEIANVEEALVIAAEERSSERVDVDRALVVGAHGALEFSTDLEAGTQVRLTHQADGSFSLQPISRPHASENGQSEAQIELSKETSRLSSSPESRDLVRLVSDPTRMRILKSLVRAELNVGQLSRILGAAGQPVVSRHLALLRVRGLVEPRRDGQHRYYSLTPSGRDLVEKMADAKVRIDSFGRSAGGQAKQRELNELPRVSTKGRPKQNDRATRNK